MAPIRKPFTGRPVGPRKPMMTPYQKHLATLAARRAEHSQLPLAQTPVTEERQRSRGRYRQVTVKKGDTVLTMAEKYKVPAQEITRRSGVTQLIPGQVLEIPEAPHEFTGQGTGGRRPFSAVGLPPVGKNTLGTLLPFRPGTGGRKRGEQVDPINLWEESQRLVEPRGVVMSPEQQRIRDEIAKSIPSDPLEYLKFLAKGGTLQREGNLTKVVPYEGETLYDENIRTAGERRGEEMQDYYERTHERKRELNGMNERYFELRQVPVAERDYAISLSKINYSDPKTGMVHYKGLQIPQGDFLEYINTVERDPFDPSLSAAEQSPYWQNRIFVSATREHLRGFYYGMETDNRDLFPDWVTPAQLSLMSPRNDSVLGGWGEFIISLGYAWDETKGAFIKEQLPTGGTGRSGGSLRSTGELGGGYGSGGRGYSYGDNPIRTSQYAQRDTGQTRPDIRYAQELGGIAPIHWRI